MQKHRKLVPVLEKESEGFRQFDGLHGDVQHYSIDKMTYTREREKKQYPTAI
jgi:hypothetical protein